MSEITKRPAIQRDVNPQQFLRELEVHLNASFTTLDNTRKCAVLFSGGVDSSLAALLTEKHCKDTFLITARCDGSHDARAAKRAADAMSLDLVEVKIDSENLWRTLPIIMQVINKTDRMNVEIAIPFFFAAQEARKLGYEMMVSGQGPDELFGGYARYERLFVEKGPTAVEDALWNDVSITDEANIQRDRSVIEYHGLQTYFPYLHQAFATCALTIPATLNIDPKKKPARKLMFRELAMMMGVPKEVAMAQKRATQYSSGTSKMLVHTVQEHVHELKSQSKRVVQAKMNETLEIINRQRLTGE